MAESLAQIIDVAAARKAARQGSAIGRFVLEVLRDDQPDEELFLTGASAFIRNNAKSDVLKGVLARRAKITTLALAFCADRDKLKRFLLSRGACQPTD